MSAFGQADATAAPLPAWQAHNRTVLIGLNFLNRQYMEFDNLRVTPAGVLDKENGTLRGGAIRGRWQGVPFGETLPEVYLQGEYRQHTGSISYQGYLQSGSTLTPYSATTQNELRDFRIRVGLPIAQTERLQWVPFVEYRYQNWVRDLVQYRETYQHYAGIAGVLAQWRVSPAWMLEGEGGVGSIIYAQVDVPQLSFSGTLGNRTLWTVGASANYQITNHWRAVTSARYDQYRYGQSAASNGFIEPASSTKQTDTLFGIEYQF